MRILIEAVDQASGRIDRIEQSLGRLNEAAEKASLATNLKDTGKMLQSTGAKMTAFATVPIVGALGASAKAAIDFESAMADVKKVAGLTTEQTSGFGKELLTLSRELPVSASGLAQIAASGAQLGIAQNQLAGFTTTVSKMSVAFDMSAEDAGKSIAKLMNVYKLNLDGASDMADSINQISNNSAASAGEIVNAATRIGGVAKTFGLTEVEAAALAGTFIQLGNAPEVAATAINSILPKLQTATGQTKKFQTGIESIGLSAEGMEQAVATDAAGAVDMLIQKLNQLEPAKRALAIQQMFGDGADARALGTLANNADAFQKTLGLVGDHAAYAGSMQGEFSSRAATTANQMATLRNRVTELAINVGAVMLPAVNGVLEAIAPIVSGMADFAAAHPGITQVAVAILGVVAAVGPLLVIIGSVISAVGTIITAGAAVVGFIGTLIPIISTIGTVVSLVFGGIVAAVITPLTLLVAGVAAAVAAIIIHWSSVKAFFSGLGSHISAVASNIAGAIRSMASGAISAFMGMMASAYEAGAGIQSGFMSAVGGVASAMASIVSTVLGALGGLVGQAFAMGSRVVSGIADGIRAGIGAISSAASAVASAVASKLPNSPVPEGPLQIINGTQNAGYKIAEMVAGGLNRGTGLMGDAASGAVNPVALAAGAGGSRGGGGASINYSPTINIGGNVSPQQKQDFMAMLRQHKDEIASMLGEVAARDQWLSYDA